MADFQKQTTSACSESLLGLLQVGLQWFLFVIVLALFLIFYPKELRYERAIALTGPSNDISAQDIVDGYESDSSAGDLDSLDSHIAENYSSFAADPATGAVGPSAAAHLAVPGASTPPINGEESGSHLTSTTTTTTADESPDNSGVASHLLMPEDEADERSSSAFSRLVPTFWPVWKAPRKQGAGPSPLGAYETTAHGERLPPNAVVPAAKAAADPSAAAEGLADDGEGARGVVGQTAGEGEVRFAPSMTTSTLLSRSERGLRRTRRVKRRTKEWGLALSLSWLVAFHFLFIVLVTLLLVTSLPPTSFPPPEETAAIIMGPSSRLLVSRWAAFLGFTSTILAAAQYVPQIVHTARAKLVGSLSIPMMCLQVPGSAIFVYSLALRPGVNFTSLAAYVCTGILQGVLLGLCIAWRIRERRLGVDDYGRPLP